jgi:predicted SprT family Zn-dependent metalloprotease
VCYNQKEAIKICNKLNRHFKIEARFCFRNNKIGQAYYGSRLIDLPKKDIPLAMICHELGHLLSVKKYGYYKGRGHNKRLAKTNKSIFRYAIKYLPINTLLKINNQLLLEHK